MISRPVAVVGGARPEAVTLAPVTKALADDRRLRPVISGNTVVDALPTVAVRRAQYAGPLLETSTPAAGSWSSPPTGGSHGASPYGG